MRKVLLMAAFILFAFACLFVSGCGPFWVDPYIVVKESSLNWVSIRYYNMNKLPARRIGVDIYGNGLVEVKSGTSQLVSNDFARNHESSDWSDIKTHRLHIKPEEANDIFQHLVNCGVLDREKHGKKSDKKTFQRFIAVKANICSHTYSENVNIFEEDPDLAENLLDVVREFEGTAIKGNLN
jgi:hypothetical protein